MMLIMEHQFRTTVEMENGQLLIEQGISKISLTHMQVMMIVDEMKDLLANARWSDESDD